MPKAVPLDIEALDTLADTEAEFVQSLRVKNRSPRTIETYLEAIHLLDAFLAERGHSRAVRDATAADLEAFQLAELARLKPSSVAVRFRSLRAYWNWCARARGLSRSPMADIGAPKVQESLIDVVSLDEIGALLKVTRADKTFSGYRDTALFLMLYDTGARVSEIAGIRLADLNLQSQTVVVDGKTGFRVVPFGNATAKALRYYLRARETHPLKGRSELWLGARPEPVTRSGVTQFLRRRCHEAGISVINPHRFRHTLAAELKGRGTADGQLMTLMGWRSTAMVRRYGAVVNEQQAIEAYRRQGAPSDAL